MAFAMQFPSDKRGRGALSFQNDNDKPSRAEANFISKARYVLRNNPIDEGKEYPQRGLDIMAGSLSLTERDFALSEYADHAVRSAFSTSSGLPDCRAFSASAFSASWAAIASWYLPFQ